MNITARGRAPLPNQALASIPGIFLCTVVAALAFITQNIEEHLFGRAWLETLVLAILIGTAIRTIKTPSPIWEKGIRFSSKTLLEIAVVLLGASLSLQTIAASGPLLVVSIFGVVILVLLGGWLIGRLLGLSSHMAILIACGNAICGNSAIAATAPVIGAQAKDVATAIAFTAVLGVAVVLLLPLLYPLLNLTFTQYGAIAGLSVYAVPQVLAATAPISYASVQAGTLVKLIRVLMLGPVILVLSFCFPNQTDNNNRKKPSPTKLLPWFIIGFLVMSGLRSLGLFSPQALSIMANITSLLTILSMAGLGLGVDAKQVLAAGPKVAITVTLSLIMLIGLSVALIITFPTLTNIHF